MASLRRPANFVEIGQVLPEILKILANPRWRLSRHFECSSNVKLVGNIFIATVRRPAQFCRSRSSHAGDSKDFTKAKMAAEPPLWI